MPIPAKVGVIPAPDKMSGRLVTKLVDRLESEGIGYALLRNYENFPHFAHDVDIVMDTRDVARWRNIAIAVAQDEHWDALTECYHCALSGASYPNGEVFRFYRISPPSYLQVDICHRFVVWGLPFITDQELLRKRRGHESALFMHIDGLEENMQRILQLYRLVRTKDSHEKIARYRKQILDFNLEHGDAFREILRKTFSKFGEQGLEALQRADMKRFTNRMKLGKLWFLTRYISEHPIYGVRDLYLRSKYYLDIFWLRQCGFALRVHAPEAEHRSRITEALEALRQANVLYRWTHENAESKQINWAERRIMERGGLIIKWSEPESAQLDMTKLETHRNIATETMSLLISRHQALFYRNVYQA